MPNKITWEDNLSVGISEFSDKLDKRLATLFQYEESKVQDFMRSNAPWRDRTANARNGLFAKAVSKPGNHVIVCYHTVPYGIWLEVRFSGQYAIITPTIQQEGARVMRDISKLINRLGAVA